MFIGVSDLAVAIDVWMAGMYHRRPMLDPQLERIGVGYARLPDGMMTAALRFENAARKGGSWPVAYPADKQTNVPLDYGAEYPNPVPNHGSGGYPITLQFPPFDKVTGVTAKLTDATGNPVEFFLSDPEHPATSFGQFGVICLIPKLSLHEQKADDPIANWAPEPSEGEQSWPCKDIYDLSILWEETFVLGIAGYHYNIARDHRPAIVPDAEEVLLYQRYGFALGCGSSFVRDA